MAFAFKKATKEQAKLRLGLAGPAGSGKTYTALLLASLMCERVAVIDTEHGSASKYASDFDFDVLELDNFHPNNYIEAIKAAQEAGYDGLVIDSASHEWSGTGGCLELVEQYGKRNRGGNNWAAWADVTPLHNRFIEAMHQAKMHLFVTFRSKMDYIQAEGKNGRTEIKKVGMAPITREGAEYEMDIVGEMDLDHNFVITKSRCVALADAVINKPGQQLANALRSWLTDGAPATEKPEPLAQQPQNVTPIRKTESKPAQNLPTAAELAAYGKSKGLQLADIQAAFWSVTGRDSTKGWTPNADECRAWAEEMDRRAAEAAGPDPDAPLMAKDLALDNDVPKQAPINYDPVPDDEPVGAAAN